MVESGVGGFEGAEVFEECLRAGAFEGGVYEGEVFERGVFEGKCFEFSGEGDPGRAGNVVSERLLGGFSGWQVSARCNEGDAMMQ